MSRREGTGLPPLARRAAFRFETGFLATLRFALCFAVFRLATFFLATFFLEFFRAAFFLAVFCEAGLREGLRRLVVFFFARLRVFFLAAMDSLSRLGPYDGEPGVRV